ncbi:MAG TPA: threonine--tRNA ligase [Acidimicrobiales bacterium]|jgi:threonyl-tRNA synthetase|nr:threonine--tRNA ligase [Acidimicrobiales bacterium]
MTDLNVELPDGSVRTLGEGSSALDLAKAIGSRLAKDALAARVNGVLTDLSTPLADHDKVSIVTPASEDGREVLRHSSAHVMAQAVTRLWPGAHYAIGPAINDGFYYDFELPGGAHFSDDDLLRVDAEMRAIIAEEQPFVRAEYSVDEGLALFRDQPFKIEIIEAVAHGGSDEDLAEAGSATVVSTYSNTSTFVDLCRGPHVPSTARLGHFQLTRVAGAYWRGDETKPQLQRIYGTAWESKDALAAHVAQLAEAEKRDHRRLGHELDLFSFPSEIGPGLAVFHPKGGIIRRVLEEYSRHRHEVSGYEFVYSPHISKADLFETSGHLTWFAESMYPPMVLDEGQRYYLKPMNCPFHVLIFKARQRSYRELPLRMFEFGSVYRYEKSGVVQGLTRVRGMTQDDAHIFCTREQMADELASLLSFVLDLLRDFGLNEFYLELSTRPPGKAVGSDEEWAEAESTLASVANAAGLDLVHDPGGGAFYGPKISVQARDAIGRTHQMSTIQLDFQTPANFDATYVSPDNARERPIMIHRALFGSVERFMAILIEHYAGNLPTWLCPEQVRVLGVRDDHDDYAYGVAARLRERGVRVSVEAAAEPLGARIRKAKLEKIPYVVVVGDDDLAKGTLGINARGSNDPERGVAVEVFSDRLVDEIERHASPEAP